MDFTLVMLMCYFFISLSTLKTKKICSYIVRFVRYEVFCILFRISIRSLQFRDPAKVLKSLSPTDHRCHLQLLSGTVGGHLFQYFSFILERFPRDIM